MKIQYTVRNTLKATNLGSLVKASMPAWTTKKYKSKVRFCLIVQRLKNDLVNIGRGCFLNDDTRTNHFNSSGLSWYTVSVKTNFPT